MFSHKLTENTELRLLEERHAQGLTDLTDRNREHLGAWLPWVDTNRTVEDRKNFIRGALKQFAENNGFQAGIWHEGRLAGVIGYHSIDWDNHSTALGYWLGIEFQGRGLATVACRALVSYAFEELGLNRVSIACATENERAAPYPRGWASDERAYSAKQSGSTIILSITRSTPLSRASGRRTPRFRSS